MVIIVRFTKFIKNRNKLGNQKSLIIISSIDKQSNRCLIYRETYDTCMTCNVSDECVHLLTSATGIPMSMLYNPFYEIEIEIGQLYGINFIATEII